MSETQSPRYYKVFQKLALVSGIALSATGYALEQPITIYLGGIILLHALIALVILLVDDSRASTTSKN